MYGCSYVIEGVSRACGTLNAVTVASQRWSDSQVSEIWRYSPVEFTRILLSKTRREVTIELNHSRRCEGVDEDQ